MKVYQTNEIKNIALLGNDGSGKTTLTEALLYESGIIKRRGRITAKNTVSDYFPVEQEYGYSVFSTVYHVEWNGKKLNIIDCPGSDDFVGAAITALNVTDTAILLLNGQYGPEVGTQNHFRYTEKLGKPVIFLVNQLDNEKCDYDHILSQLRENYGSKVVPVQYPLATGPNFNSLIDVLLMKKYSWGPEGGAPTIEEIPAEEMEKAQEWHKALVEAAAEHDESLMEKFFESESLTEDEMREGIRKGLAARGMFPVFCVCAGKDMGVRRLMEFLGNVVPFVDEMPSVHNTRGVAVLPDPNASTSLYFFKTSVEPHIGDVQYFKVMSGVVREGDDLTNADRGSKERMSQLFVCAGANREKVEELRAGDIGCTVKLKDVKLTHLQEYFKEKTDFSDAYMHRMRVLLNGAFKTAILNNLIKRNPFEGFKAPKSQKEENIFEVLTKEEQAIYIEHAKEDVIILTALFTGMRLGELLALRWEHVDLDNRIISVEQSYNRAKVYNKKGEYETTDLFKSPKSKSGTRKIPIPQFLVKELILE